MGRNVQRNAPGAYVAPLGQVRWRARLATSKLFAGGRLFLTHQTCPTRSVYDLQLCDTYPLCGFTMNSIVLLYYTSWLCHSSLQQCSA